MKISEVTKHPSVVNFAVYNMLLQADEDKLDEIVEFIMDERNAQTRRVDMIKHFDELHDDVQDSYSFQDIEDFMDLRGPDVPVKKPSLYVVEEPYNDDIPGGEYEICTKCLGKGCVECEGGLKDITGQFKMPDLGDE